MKNFVRFIKNEISAGYGKLITAIAAAVILSVSSAFAEASDGVELANKLYRLGVINENIFNSYNPDAEMSRAEFAFAVASMMGYSADDALGDPSKVFIDVTGDTEYASSIYQMYAAGIMIGDDTAAFEPERSITYGEVVKTAVVMLGYYKPSEQKGGFSQGYINQAASAGLLSGVNGSAGQNMTQKNIFKLLDNMLDAKMMVIDTSYGDYEYNAGDKDYTVLEKKLGLSAYEGVVDAVEYTSLKSDTEELADNAVRVGGTVFRLEYTEGDEYLGRYVKIYYDSDTDKIAYIEVKENRNTVLNVSADMLYDTTSNLSVDYIKDGSGSVKRAVIDDEAVFVYNGKKINFVTKEDLLIDEGSITLVDNDSSGKYDVVIIESYEMFVVDGVLATDEIIKFKYGMGSLDISEASGVRIRYYAYDLPAEVGDIARWSVLSIKKSRNLSGTVLYDVHITNESFDETVTSQNTDNDDYIITMSDGKSYRLSPSYIKRVESGNSESAYPTLGNKATCYLDKFGKIAAINTVSGAKNYAYVVKCFYDTDEEKTRIRLFTKDAEFIDFEVKEKVRVNDTTVDQKLLPELLKQATGNGTVNQLIVYSANTENQIAKVQTAADKTNETYYVATDDEFVLNAHPINATTGEPGGIRFYKYLAENRPLYFLEGTTINFQIPSDISQESDYKIGTKLASTDVKLGAPVYVYDAGNGGMIGAVVSSPVDDGDYSLPAVIDKIITTIDEDDQVCKEIIFVGGSSVMTDGDKIKYSQPLKDTTDASTNWLSRVDYSNVKLEDLKRGDVITYTKLNGKLETLRVLVKADNIGLVRVDGQHLAKNGNILGEVISVSDNKRSAIIYYVDMNGNERYQSLFINGSVYKVDTKDNEVSYSSTSDIEPGDTVLINSFWWSAKVVIIFR